MLIENSDTFLQDPNTGVQASICYGSAAPGTGRFFTRKGIGTIYHRKVAAGHIQRWEKTKNDGLAGDWACRYGIISDYVTVSQFTDGGSTSGTFALTNQVPIYATVDYITVKDVTGFAGDTTAALTVGDGTDVDRYNTGTPSVFATATQIDTGVPSGTKYHSAAKSITLTITGTADFTSIVTNGAGKLTVELVYHF